MCFNSIFQNQILFNLNIKQIIQTTLQQHDDIFVSSLTNKDDKNIDSHSFYLMLIIFEVK